MAKLQKNPGSGTETLRQKAVDKKTQSPEQQHSLWNSWRNNLASIDEKYTEKMSVCAKPESSMGQLRPLMRVLEFSCHGVPWFVCTMVGLLLAFKPWDIEMLMNLFLALCLDMVVVGLLKMILRRPRPSNNQADMFLTLSVDQFSFPSGHATRAAMLLCFFGGKVVPPGSRLIYLLAVWSVSVSLSRVLLGRHHLSDVLCGFIVGLCQYQILLYIWLPEQICVDVLEPYLGHFHL